MPAPGELVRVTREDTALRHLPPHLREVCTILAAGLVRLRSRTAEDFAKDEAEFGDSSLHFTAGQSVCANPRKRRTA
jgi:hypothetical protein